MLATRLAFAHIDAMLSGAAPARALLLGTAGSGKSRLLRHLRQHLTASGHTVVLAGADDDVDEVSDSDVLLVDDAHAWDERSLATIAARLTHSDARIIVAARPGAHPGALTDIMKALERTQPAIMLGHLARADVLTALGEHPQTISPECVDSILELTGGSSWLVAESLVVHEGCRGSSDPRHAEIREALHDVIAHRLRAASPEVRAVVEARSLLEDASEPTGRTDDAVQLEGYAAGLLLRNGQPAPAVRSAVLATVSADRLAQLYTARLQDPALEQMPDGTLGALRDARVAAALLSRGDALATEDPHRAAELYRAAEDAGADAAAIAARRAETAWAHGNVDDAAAALDAVVIDPGHPDHHRAADTAAAVWAARGLASMSDAVYRSFEPARPDTSAKAAIAAFAVADRASVLAVSSTGVAHTMPSTLTVAMELLTQGLRDGIAGSAESALIDLVRASEMYSASASTAPIPELPAVIAAITAINLGELEVAHSVLDAAVHAQHGGRWAHDRLLLWRAWTSLQLEQAHDVDTAVQALAPTARSLTPRDRLLFDAISLSIARRYDDATALVTAWRAARPSLLRARFDVFAQLPLGEFVLTAARVGESDRLRSHFDEALAQLERLGTPPLWTAHLHWTGIQQGILLNRPDDLAPHARALVEAAPRSRLAARMAQAGRVWTAVLSGTVDADEVERAALGLATVGLAWDGARLAGHGAGRTDDRRISSRLLACARRLHPRDESRPTAVEEEPSTASPSRPRSYDELSPREREVAALVIEGKTYAEIGASIFISPRTAEHHIARIRRRLGATTRSDLITKLRLVIEDGGDTGTSSVDDQRASA